MAYGNVSPPLSLDLSSIPPLVNPSPPSNTLLVTNLQDPSIFHPASLQKIRDLIDNAAPLYSFSPLKSLHRIICSFYDIDSAVRIRQLLDRESVMGDQMRIYFGEATPLNPTDKHLHAPKSDRLFFISPPPSPPHGWEIRNEEPPNKAVHAKDLAAALGELQARPEAAFMEDSPVEEVRRTGDGIEREGTRVPNRRRSGSSTIVYHPEDHGDSPHLPAVTVEDTTQEIEVDSLDEPEPTNKVVTKTARPPVELM